MQIRILQFYGPNTAASRRSYMEKYLGESPFSDHVDLNCVSDEIILSPLAVIQPVADTLGVQANIRIEQLQANLLIKRDTVAAQTGH